MWRLEARDPPPFLIDEDRRIGTPNNRAQIRIKCAYLFWALAVAGKQDEPQRTGGSKERAFSVSHSEAGKAEDGGKGHRRVLLLARFSKARCVVASSP